MKAVLFALASGFIAIAPSAHAETDRFASVSSFFDQGREVSAEEIEGYYSGRCYDKGNRNIPANTMLAVIARSADHDNGPAFPTPKIMKAMELGYDGRSEDAFNNMDPSMVAADLDSSWSYYKEVQVKDGTLVSQFTADDEQAINVDVRIRAYNDYIVTTYVHTGDQPETYYIRGGGMMNVNPGETYGACYYFKKLTSNQ